MSGAGTGSFRRARRVQELGAGFFGTLDARVAEARAAGVDVIDVSKGNPDLPTPPHIVRRMQDAVADPANHGYPSFAVRPAAREAIAARYLADHGVRLDPVAEVAAFHGSHEGLMAAVLASVDAGDVLVVPDPGYPAYASAASFAGARMHLLPLERAQRYQPRAADLSAIPQAAALLLNYPHNPTGAVATPATFALARESAARWNGVFIHDFAYSSLGFEGGRPLSALVGGTERVVEVSTLSKTYNMAGWRFGFAAGDAEVIAAMKRYQSHAFSTIFGATQDAAAAALAGDQGAADELVRTYRTRRDLVVGGLRAQGWDLDAPEGGFFVWVRVPGGDDVGFSLRLLAEQGVAVAPGSGFGPAGSGFVRIGLVHPEQRLAELLERFATLTPVGSTAASASGERS